MAQNQDLGEVLIPETHFCSMPQGCGLIFFPDLGQTGIVISKVAGSSSNYQGNSENFPPSFLLSQTWQGKSLLLVAFLVALLASSSLLGRGSRWHFRNSIKISLLFLQALGTNFQRISPFTSYSDLSRAAALRAMLWREERKDRKDSGLCCRGHTCSSQGHSQEDTLM